jgi:hypothetical protein
MQEQHATTSQSRYSAGCDDQASSHPHVYSRVRRPSFIWFLAEERKSLFPWRKSLLIFLGNMSTCCQVITEVTKIMCNTFVLLGVDVGQTHMVSLEGHPWFYHKGACTRA